MIGVRPISSQTWARTWKNRTDLVEILLEKSEGKAGPSAGALLASILTDCCEVEVERAWISGRCPDVFQVVEQIVGHVARIDYEAVPGHVE